MIERLPELPVVVADQVADVKALVLGPHGHVPDLLRQPEVIRIADGLRHIDTPRPQVNDDEYKGVHPPAPGQYLGAGEVTAQQATHVGVDELIPVTGWGPARAATGRVDSRTHEDVFDTGVAELDTDLPEFSHNPHIPPGQVVPSHFEYCIDDALACTLPPDLLGFPAGGGIPKPPSVGSGLDDQEIFVDLVVKPTAKGQKLSSLLW